MILMAKRSKLVFRPFMDTPETVRLPDRLKILRHPLFAWVRLRPIFAQHTSMEHDALQRSASGCRCVVEIGVAEGASALALREVIASDGSLYLIDPYHLSRVPLINAQRRAAKEAVSRSKLGKVSWIEKFSFDAVKSWNRPIDFLFIDGDHEETCVIRDWNEWSRFVRPGGRVAFHDARVFENGWPSEDDGPVKVVQSLFRDQRLPNWKIIDEVHSLVIVERI